tara:strand:+ start:187 stop:531 length:345 start_codon:yes stop_codon:yes gene_type:complete
MPLYKTDPNDPRKQVPANQRTGPQFSVATCPTNEIITKRPTYVNINTAGTYAFLYESTASIGGTHAGPGGGYITGSTVVVNHGNLKLDINPIAWRRCDGADAVGQITFVYVRVR